MQAFHQPQNNVFSYSQLCWGDNLFTFLYTLIWLELNSIAICFCKHTNVIFQQILQEPGDFLWGRILPFSVSFFFYNIILVLRCMGSEKLISRYRNLFFIQFSAVPVQYFLAYSSLFVILLGISTSPAMFCVAPWKGST